MTDTAEEVDAHLVRFEAHYKRLKHRADRTEEWKVERAEFMASRPAAFDVFIQEDSLSTLVPFPTFPEDYPDTKQPSRVGGR